MFIAMKYVAGETLAHWLRSPRSTREIIDRYREAGRGLTAAHATGIVHRDFKPENVLIGNDGRIRIGDFGLARAANSSDAQRTTAIDASTDDLARESERIPGQLTAPSTLLGTPYYMAPELFHGGEADALSDQFSYSVALATALGARCRSTGRRLPDPGLGAAPDRGSHPASACGCRGGSDGRSAARGGGHVHAGKHGVRPQHPSA
jgi:serine/threonine protein kinase